MDELTESIQQKVPWCMLFTNDIILEDETRYEVEGKLEIWQAALESRVSRD